MARVTIGEVKEIIDLDSTVVDSRVAAFITAGNLLVTNVFSGDTSVGAATLKEIERNVVAHLCCSLDPRAISEKDGDISVKYTGKYGMKFKSTSYGQTALLLDPTGKLARAGAKQASLAVVDYSTSLIDSD